MSGFGLTVVQKASIGQFSRVSATIGEDRAAPGETTPRTLGRREC